MEIEGNALLMSHMLTGVLFLPQRKAWVWGRPSRDHSDWGCRRGQRAGSTRWCPVGMGGEGSRGPCKVDEVFCSTNKSHEVDYSFSSIYTLAVDNS